MTTALWTEKYRPKTLDEYVVRDQQQKKQIQEWINKKSIPNLLFSGPAGTGKSTLAKVLCNELQINPFDFLEINASRTNSVDDIRDKIVNFVQMIPFGEFKVVLLDEADFLSLSAQAALRGVIEEYHKTARFIFTCNFPNRVINAIHSRCQGFHLEKLDPVEFTARVATILINEGIEFDIDTLDTFVKSTFPDLRKCINSLQMNSVDGKLQSPSANDKAGPDFKFEMVELFKQGRISDARKLICSNARPEEIEEVYRWLYDNLNLLGKNDSQQENAILIIKQALVDHTICSDSEINFSACMIRLARNLESV